jgi:hypothetical protein
MKSEEIAATWLKTDLLLPFEEDQIKELVSSIKEAREDRDRPLQPVTANKRSKPRGAGVPNRIPAFPQLLFTILVVASLCFVSYVYDNSRHSM